MVKIPKFCVFLHFSVPQDPTQESKFPGKIVIYSREKLKLFFPEGGATPKDVYFPSRRRGKYKSEGVGTPQGEKSSISPRSL